MPSAITFPPWVCLTPTLSWEHLGKQEGKKSRASFWGGSSHAMILLPHWGDLCLSKDWLKMGSPTCRTRCRNHQEPPWAGELGRTSSSLALNFLAKKGPWTENPLWGVSSSRPSWSEQDCPLLPGWAPRQVWFVFNSSPQSPQTPWKLPGAPQNCSNPPAGRAFQCLYISPCHTGYLPL